MASHGAKYHFKSTPVVTMPDNPLLANLRVRVCSDLGERAASASAFQPYSCDASTAAGTSVLQHEGEDESSHNDTVSLHCTLSHSMLARVACTMCVCSAC